MSATALPAWWGVTGRLLWQLGGKLLRFGVPLNLGIAAVMMWILDTRWSSSVVWSLCIGLSCQAMIEGGSYFIAAWRGLPLLQGPVWPGWRWMGPWVMIGSFLGFKLGTWLAMWVVGPLFGQAPGAVLNHPGSLSGTAVFAVLVGLGVTYYFWSRANLLQVQAKADAAARVAAENHLRLLQSQLEPHMLFNTLANLRVLISLDPAQAEQMLDHLVAFLRSTLQASRTDWHPLSQEFERLQDYLALMSVRMGDRLQTELDLPVALATHPVPPLLLQPLVENAIQHGLEPKIEGGCLCVRARHDAATQTLVLEVQDSGLGLGTTSASPSTAGTGFGTEHVRRRLHTLYGERAQLQLWPVVEGGTLARIEMPWNADVRTPPPADR